MELVTPQLLSALKLVANLGIRKTLFKDEGLWLNGRQFLVRIQVGPPIQIKSKVGIIMNIPVSYRGNELRLFDGNGKLIKVYTIDEFRKERAPKGRQSLGAIVQPKSKPRYRDDYRPAVEDLSDVLNDARGASSYDRAVGDN
jgi:hypothetical protein